MTPMSAVGPRGSRTTIRLNASTFLCAPFPPKHTFSLAVVCHRKHMKYCLENGKCISILGILYLSKVMPTVSDGNSNTICYVHIKIRIRYYSLIALNIKKALSKITCRLRKKVSLSMKSDRAKQGFVLTPTLDP